MKKLLLFSVAASLFLFSCKDDAGTEPGGGSSDPLAVADVSQSNTSFVIKFSGTNCPPCGQWGWSMFSDIISGAGDDAIYMTNYGQNFVAQLFIIDEATTIQDDYGITGYPSFGANGEAKLDRAGGRVNTANEKQMVYDAVNDHADASVAINTGVNFMIDGDQIKIKYKTKAFEALSGNNKLAIYVLEDKVIGYQAGHSEGNNASHKHVFRAATDGAYGADIGALTAGQEVEGDATVDMESSWDADHIEVVAVMYEKKGTKHNFLNAANGVKK